MRKIRMTADYRVSNHGSIVLVHPAHEDARDSLKDMISPDATWFAGSLAVEPRYVGDLIAGLEGDGWAVAA